MQRKQNLLLQPVLLLLCRILQISLVFCYLAAVSLLVTDSLPLTMIFQFFIVNSSGGMIYAYESGHKTEINILLVLASSISSLNELARKALHFNNLHHCLILEHKQIHIYRTLTGMLFIFVSDSSTGKAFEASYKHYCDYALSNPFYQPGMPITCTKFMPSQFF